MKDLIVGTALLVVAIAALTLSMAVRQLNDRVADLEVQTYVTDRTLCRRVEEARC